MKIAQVAPFWEAVPPVTYGGIELVVHLFTEKLVQRGHEVTLFAAGDSLTSAKLLSVCPRALRQDFLASEYEYYEMLQLRQVYEQSKKFDIIHFHDKCASLPFVDLISTPTVRTLHYPFTKGSCCLFNGYQQHGYISISQAQRQPMPHLNYLSTVYNGIDLSNYPFCCQPLEPPYLAFLGRMSPDKGPQHAIAIAKQTGWQLKMAGKVDGGDRNFFDSEIAPKIDGTQIQFLGEVNHAQKVELLGQAAATLFPIQWNEPFGLVMIESMATGTPVIGTNQGSVSEVIADGKTGFVCHTHEEMAAMIPEALKLERSVCREYVQSKFTVKQMVDGYEAAYRQLSPIWH
jgi:glycosyltransferase involved in cell wall biosynthesis